MFDLLFGHPGRSGPGGLPLLALLLSMACSIIAHADDQPSNDDLTASAVDILDQYDDTQAMLETALTQLQEGQIKPFLVSYGATVHQYVDGTVAIRNYARRSGESAAEIQFALASLDDLIQNVAGNDTDTDNRWRPQMTNTRSMILAQLQSLRNKHESIGDTQDRRRLRGQMQTQMQRLVTLDQWLQPTAIGPSMASQYDSTKLQSAKDHLQSIADQQRTDHQLLTLAAQMLTESMDKAQVDIDRGLQLMAVQIQMPRDLDTRMASTSKIVQTSLNQVRESRLATRRSMDAMATEIATPDADDRQAVIGQVNQLLGVVNPPAAIVVRPVRPAPTGTALPANIAPATSQSILRRGRPMAATPVFRCPPPLVSSAR